MNLLMRKLEYNILSSDFAVLLILLTHPFLSYL